MPKTAKALKGFQNFLLRLWRDESGQGATEYILILVVVGVIVVAFKGKIKKIITERTEEVGGKIRSAISQINN